MKFWKDCHYFRRQGYEYLSTKSTGIESVKADTDKPAKASVVLPAEKEQGINRGTISPVVAGNSSNVITNHSLVKSSSPPDPSVIPTNVAIKKCVGPAKDTIMKDTHSSLVPAKRSTGMPASLPTTTASTVAQKVPLKPAVPVTPAKRPTTTANSTSSATKRTKPNPVPLTSSIQPAVLRGTLDSPSPRPMSIERQVSEQRKKLDTVRRKRQEMITKQGRVDSQLQPYKQRMAAELERLNAEIMEVEAEYAEDEEHLTASLEMLREFRKADGST